MGFYVYRYIHPDDPWVYVGKTENIDRRIREHNLSDHDNIASIHHEFLNKCSIYYIELRNRVDMDIAERYLISKYKPMLNKRDNVREESTLDMRLPTWQFYDNEFVTTEKVSSVVEEARNSIEIFVMNAFTVTRDHKLDRISRHLFNEMYEDFCKDDASNPFIPVPLHARYDILRKMGVRLVKSRGLVWYTGLRCKN